MSNHLLRVGHTVVNMKNISMMWKDAGGMYSVISPAMRDPLALPLSASPYVDQYLHQNVPEVSLKDRVKVSAVKITQPAERKRLDPNNFGWV